MSTKKMPKGLPPLPPVPAGWDAWEYMGKGWSNNCTPAGSPWGLNWGGNDRDWTDGCRNGFDPNVIPAGNSDTHYIRAIKRPAKKPALAKGKAKGKPVKARLIKNRWPGKDFHDALFVLPADAASVAHMEGQAANAINIETGHHIKTCHAIAKAALASLGVRA